MRLWLSQLSTPISNTQKEMTLFDNPIDPSTLFQGDIVYYANGHAVENKLVHLLQVTQVASVTSSLVILDNERKFSLETGEEVTRSSKGALYPYTQANSIEVSNAQRKLGLVNDVRAIDFNSLSVQQLTMIRDVANGAFTQIAAPSPCSGCGSSSSVNPNDDEYDEFPDDEDDNDYIVTRTIDDDDDLEDAEDLDEDDNQIEIITA